MWRTTSTHPSALARHAGIACVRAAHEATTSATASAIWEPFAATSALLVFSMQLSQKTPATVPSSETTVASAG